MSVLWIYCCVGWNIRTKRPSLQEAWVLVDAATRGPGMPGCVMEGFLRGGRHSFVPQDQVSPLLHRLLLLIKAASTSKMNF